MKRQSLLSYLIFLVVCIMASSNPGDASAYSVRKAVYAGRFYPASSEELKKTIAQFTRTAQSSPVRFPKDKQLRALILPHAGYVYSGQTAAYSASVLSGRHFSKVYSHGAGPQGRFSWRIREHGRRV